MIEIREEIISWIGTTRLVILNCRVLSRHGSKIIEQIDKVVARGSRLALTCLPSRSIEIEIKLLLLVLLLLGSDPAEIKIINLIILVLAGCKLIKSESTIKLVVVASLRWLCLLLPLLFLLCSGLLALLNGFLQLCLLLGQLDGSLQLLLLVVLLLFLLFMGSCGAARCA